MVALRQAAQGCWPHQGCPGPARLPPACLVPPCRPGLRPVQSSSQRGLLSVCSGFLGLSRKCLGPERSPLSACWSRACQFHLTFGTAVGHPGAQAAHREITRRRGCLLDVNPSERPELSEKGGDSRTGPRGRWLIVLEDSHLVSWEAVGGSLSMTQKALHEISGCCSHMTGSISRLTELRVPGWGAFSPGHREVTPPLQEQGLRRPRQARPSWAPTGCSGPSCDGGAPLPCPQPGREGGAGLQLTPAGRGELCGLSAGLSGAGRSRARRGRAAGSRCPFWHDCGLSSERGLPRAAGLTAPPRPARRWLLLGLRHRPAV